MKQANLIEENESPYASPMECVPKPDGQLRFYIDFRIVNKDMVNNAYPMHYIEQQLESMAGATVFTNLNLTQVHH